VYDGQNGLVDDEGNLVRRGATSLYSASDHAVALESLYALYMRVPAANRVLTSSPSHGAAVSVLDGALAPVALGSGIGARSRPVSIGDYAVFGTGPNTIFLYAGSLKAVYTTGTVSVTNGSATVTGAGTSWLANTDKGAILSVGTDIAVVKSVDSDTQVTLTAPWAGSTAAGHVYSLGPTISLANTTVAAGSARAYVIAGGASSPRLMLCSGNQIWFTEPDALTFSANNNFMLPANVNIVGAQGDGDTALVFTTLGVWHLQNLSFDPVDDAGNPQWVVEQINHDVILWDDYGIAAWDAGLVVPAIDDVYLMGSDGGVRVVSEGIRPLYREYVQAGYQPGLATVHRGHYKLPILNGTTVVDTFVCRLDRPTQTASGAVIYPWTRWEGHASGSAYAVLVEEAAREPKLLGLAGKRVTDLTGTLGGQGAEDADGNDIAFSFTTNDLPLGFGTATRLRSWYEMTLDPVTISAAATPSSDTFTRANETPLASPWLAWRSGKPNLASNAAEIDSDLSVTECSATRPETIAAGCYAQATFKTAATYSGDPAMTYYVGIRLTAHSSAAGGYVMLLEPGSGGWQARIAKGSARTSVATSTVRNYSAVQAIRLVASGSYLYALVKIGGTWTVAVSVSDSDFRDEGLVGFGITKFFGTPVAVDEFDWAEIDAPSILPEFSSDQDGGSFTALTALGEQGGQSGWGVSDGSRYSWANVNKKRDRIRFRFTLAGAATSLKVRAVELLSRASGKQ
jgi:hypothetical protein